MQQAVALGLPSPQRHLLGHTLMKLGRTAEALAFWQKLLAEDPKDNVARNQIEAIKKNSPAVKATPLTPQATTRPAARP